MEQYPSIPKNNPDGLTYHIYEKLDGSNIRFEYGKNKGFYKFGSRTQLIDTTSLFGSLAIPLFKDSMQTNFEDFASSKKLEGMTVFCELYGEESFAGFHNYEAPFTLKVIDVHVKRKGFLPPEEYNTLVTELCVPHACYLGKHVWDSSLVEQVNQGIFPGQTFEGVVGKRWTKNKVQTNKVKSTAWIEKVHEFHGSNAYKFL